MAWKDWFNTAGLPPGNYRSIGGYAAESLAIGRALQCGYNLFFKAWRDSPYDGVLDHRGVLFRVEIKGSSTTSLNVTSGGRAGAQINRQVASRAHIISRSEVDIVMGVNSTTGDCCIIPTEILAIFGTYSLTWTKLEAFKEKWKLLKGRRFRRMTITTEDIRKGFLGRSDNELRNICRGLRIAIPPRNRYVMQWQGFRRNRIQGLTPKRYMVLQIWRRLLL